MTAIVKVRYQQDGKTVAEVATFPADFPAESIPAIFTDDASTIGGITQGWVKNGDGTFSPPTAPAVTAAELVAYAQAGLAAMLAAGRTFNVATSGSAVNVLCDGSSATRADLAMLALYGQANPTGTKSWVDNNGVTTVLTGAQLVTLATDAGIWIDDGYAALGAALAGVTSGSIAATAAVDSAMAAFVTGG